MSTPANVQSSDAIEAVRLALLSFGEQVGDALTELSAEMRRVLEWLEHDRPRYWQSQLRVANDMVHEAHQALNRCLMFPVANERPSCYEERMALKKAQARLAYCEQKSERVRTYQRKLRHEMFEYEGRISQLVQLVEIDVPQSIGMLNKIMRHLEEYQSLRAANPRAAYDSLSVAREIWPAGEGATAKEVSAVEPSEEGKVKDDVDA